MGKNDFDIDFDYEKEFGFDPKAFLGSEEDDTDIDLSEFSDEELGLSSHDKAEEELDLDSLDLSGDYDMSDDLDLDDFLNLGNQPSPQEEPEEEMEEELFADEAEPEEPELLTRKADPEETAMRESEYTEEEVLESGDYQEQQYDEEEYHEEPKARKEREPIKLPKITLPKLPKPNIFTKFFDLYFGPLVDKSKMEELVDANNPRRRRRKSKTQIFKEVYLPPILACLCLILVLSFTIGSVSNAIAQNRIEQEAEDSRLDASQSAADLQEQMVQAAINEANRLAAGYDYEAAIEALKTAGDISTNKELAAKHSEFVNAQTALLEYKNISDIPNLSFHVLIHDLARAMADDDDLAGSYNKNFVSTAEFTQILNNLYNNGYVLVDFDSFVDVNKDLNGNDQFYAGSLWLPADKKPVMITETMVNYYDYMVDDDKDGTPDANGDGFANKLVVDNNGNIKAEYVDSNGQTLTGNYDLVPILEDFIKEHPDFSYRGARAILAVSGYQGVFGYRLNTSYIQSKGQDYYDAQKIGAQKIVNALKEKGYTIACYTYGDIPYGGKDARQISADLTDWSKQIVEVIGPVDTFVFAKKSGITDYSGSVFEVMQQTGFRYYINMGNKPWAEVNTSYVRQNRLMVTGENMCWYPDQFKNLFDCAAILDVTTRGDVPKSG